MTTTTLTSSTRLVGRAEECAAIARLLDDARSGRSGSLVLRGEAGLGKTALLDWAAERATGMRVLRVAGAEAEQELPFAGLQSLLRTSVARPDALPGPQRDALAAALGVTSGNRHDRFLVSVAVLSLLAAEAEIEPIVCLVDDAQWLDRSSAEALVFAARRFVAERVAIVFAGRDGEAGTFDSPGLRQLTLTRLPADAADALLRGSAPTAAEWVRRRLSVEANGNPLALLELPAALTDRQLAGDAPLPEALPLTERLRTAFRQRLTRLPEDTRIALLVAATEQGGELRIVRSAAAELGLPPDALDPAEQIGLIEIDGDAVTFRHPLVRSVVRESAALGRRQRVHAALGKALELGGHVDRSLLHRALATDATDEALAVALEAFGHQSQGRGDVTAATSAFERAALLTADETLRSRRLTSAAEAAWSAGQVDRASDRIDQSLPGAEGEQRVRLLQLRGVIEGRRGWLKDGVAALRQAATLSNDPARSLQMLREACSMAIYAGDFDQVIAIGRHASKLAQADDVDRYIATAIGAYAAELSGAHARGAALASQAIVLAGRLEDPMCLISAAHTAARHGIAADGLVHATRAVEIARRRGLVTTLPLALQAQARAFIGRSRFDLASSAAEEGRRLALDVGQSWAASLNLAYLARIDALRGDEPAVRERVAELGALLTANGAHALAGSVAMAEGLLELGLGRPGPALDRLLDVISSARPESNPLFVAGVPDAVEAAVRANRLDEVTGAFEHFRTWVQALPNPARRALLARCRALMQEQEAEAHFVEAIELADAVSPFDLARSQLLYGEWLRRGRRRVEARRHLRNAVAGFDRLGLRPWETRARAELRASGETARSRRPDARDDLTPQELQIARLAAGGLTNPEIAAQLFLSPRTIDYHLRKVFIKLEIASRSELAGIALGEP